MVAQGRVDPHRSAIVKRLSIAHLTFLALASSLAAGPFATAGAQTAAAEADFKRICAACHTVGGGVRIGPDLLGVTDRHSDDWLLRFIISSQAMVKSGDPAAVALFDKYKVVMPDAPYTEAEIGGIIELLKSGWTSEAAIAAAPAGAPPSEAEIRTGAELFQGVTRLSNGGPACSSCHHVSNTAVIGGGVLAKSLTQAFGRLGGPGIQAILQAPPFPVMQQAYKDRPLSKDEIAALVGYLRNANSHPTSYNQPREDGIKLLLGGLGGLCLLLGLYSFTWRRRKRGPVNQRVFARQVRSR